MGRAGVAAYTGGSQCCLPVSGLPEPGDGLDIALGMLPVPWVASGLSGLALHRTARVAGAFEVILLPNPGAVGSPVPREASKPLLKRGLVDVVPGHLH